MSECESLWIKVSTKCIHVNYKLLFPEQLWSRCIVHMYSWSNKSVCFPKMLFLFLCQWKWLYLCSFCTAFLHRQIFQCSCSSLFHTIIFTFTFMHLADAFIKSDLQLLSGYTFLISMCVPWESNPQPFALLT